jgi:hypothetical protein
MQGGPWLPDCVGHGPTYHSDKNGTKKDSSAFSAISAVNFLGRC